MKRIDVEVPFTLPKQTVVCLGFFDGVHIGHVRLIEEAKAVATAKGYHVCVHTFAQMPQRVLRPNQKVLELTPLDEKEALLQAAGADVLAVSQFTETMMRMRAKDFFYAILINKLRAKHIVIGFHHRFGYLGEMDAKGLAALCAEAGIGLSVLEPVMLADGSLVSSSTIRSLLLEGDYVKAELMLGREYNTFS